MNKIIRLVAISLCAALCISFCLTSCSKSEPEIKISEENTILVDAFASLTEGNYAEAISAFSRYNDREESPNLAIEIGMGKAYFGMGDYQNAENAFEIACGIETDRADVIHYLGEAQMQSGNYSAAIETFELFLEKEPDNITVLSKLEQSLRKNKDYVGLYKFFEKRIGVVNEDNPSEQNYYSGKLLEAAQLTKDDRLILSTIERFRDTPQGYAFDMGYKAYTLFLSGDEEGAKALLFDVENIDALVESAGRIGCYFGEFSDLGAYHGRGLIIFGSDKKNSACNIYIGEFVDGKPNGTGLGYRGSIKEVDHYTYIDNVRTSTQMLRKANYYIEADWKNGIPEGYVTSTNEYTNYSLEGVFQYSNKTIETAVYEDGLAQGEVWSENHYYNPSNSYDTRASYTKYLAVDGVSVPFEVTVNGKTVMAYSAFYGDSKDEVRSAREEAQNRQFKF